MPDRLKAIAVITVASTLLACKLLPQQDNEPKQEPAASASPVAPASTDVTFASAVPKPGTKGSAQRKTALKFTMDGKVYRETTAADLAFEVQNSDDFRVTKAVLEVKDLYTVKQTGSGDEKRSVNPLSGSRYTVTRTDDGKLSALDSAGSKVASSQLKLIKDEFGGAFEKNQIGAFLPDRPLKLGEKLVPPSDAVLKMLEMRDDGKTLFDGIEFILVSGTPERANFDVTMTMTQRLDGGLRLRAKLKGKIAIKPTGNWLLGVDLNGPIEVLDSLGRTKATGDLTATLNQSYT